MRARGVFHHLFPCQGGAGVGASAEPVPASFVPPSQPSRSGGRSKKICAWFTIANTLSHCRLCNPAYHLAKAAIDIRNLTRHAAGQIAE